MPGLPLRGCLEVIREKGLQSELKIIRSHYQENSGHGPYSSLANLAHGLG